MADDIILDNTIIKFSDTLADVFKKYNKDSLTFLLNERLRLQNGNIKNKNHILSQEYNKYIISREDELMAKSLQNNYNTRNRYRSIIDNLNNIIRNSTYLNNTLPSLRVVRNIISPVNTNYTNNTNNIII